MRKNSNPPPPTGQRPPPPPPPPPERRPSFLCALGFHDMRWVPEDDGRVRGPAGPSRCMRGCGKYHPGIVWPEPPPRPTVKPASDNERGLYEKYHVERLNDPAGKHAECEYYVLDLVHDRHAAPALLAYADSCVNEFPELAEDLRAEAAEIPNAAPYLVDPESEAANPVWDLVVEACQQAWPEKLLSWNTSPVELIVDLVNERDRALEEIEQLKSAAKAPRYTLPAADVNGKRPRLFYYEEAENAWCPAEGLEVDNIIGIDLFLRDGDGISIEFKRQDMTDAEFEALPEG